MERIPKIKDKRKPDQIKKNNTKKEISWQKISCILFDSGYRELVLMTLQMYGQLKCFAIPTCWYLLKNFFNQKID